MGLYYYTAVSAFIFVLVAVGHLVRLFKQWAVQIGPFSVSMALSWLGLVVGPSRNLGSHPARYDAY